MNNDKEYASKSFNLGGDKKIGFVLAADKENPDYYMWMAPIDDFWIHMVSSSLYNHLKVHQAVCTGYNFEDSGNYACTLNYNVFKNLILVGESQRLQDYTESLWNYLVFDLKVPNIVSMAINFTSDSNDNHFITLLRYGDMITINCKTNNVVIQ